MSVDRPCAGFVPSHRKRLQGRPQTRSARLAGLSPIHADCHPMSPLWESRERDSGVWLSERDRSRRGHTMVTRPRFSEHRSIGAPSDYTTRRTPRTSAPLRRAPSPAPASRSERQPGDPQYARCGGGSRAGASQGRRASAGGPDLASEVRPRNRAAMDVEDSANPHRPRRRPDGFDPTAGHVHRPPVHSPSSFRGARRAIRGRADAPSGSPRPDGHPCRP